jgi:predicted hydrolase (HD superfamily)
MAFVSEPQDTEARLHRLMDPLAQRWRQSYSQYVSSRMRDDFVTAWASARDEFDGSSLTHRFGRSLRGLPRSNATALLKKHVQQTELAGHLISSDFAGILTRSGDRDLAERVFQLIAKSPLTEVSYDFRPVRPDDRGSRETVIVRRETDVSHVYLEAILPHLSRESIPVLLEGSSASSEQVRAFVVWAANCLGHEWTTEQLDAFARDSSWKVRVNAAVARDVVASRDGAYEASAVQAIARAMR